MPVVMGTVAAAAVVVGLVWAALALHGDPNHGRDASFALVVGALLGALLQRSRLCFAGAFRDLFLARDRRLFLGLLAALAAGSAGYLVVYGAWVPDPTAGWHPQRAHIAPVGRHLVLGGVAFGLGMVLAGGCISGHLFRLGEGSGASLVALVAAIPGFALGLFTWNRLYLAEVATAKVHWLPESLGYAGALAVQFGALAILAALVLLWLPGKERPWAAPLGLAGAWRRFAREPWPAWVGGAALGVLGAFAFLRIEPLGVTSELGRVARALGNGLGALPTRLEGLDGLRGCRPAAGDQWLTQNGLLVGGLVLGSLIAALLAGEFRPRLGRPAVLLRSALGGVLLGYGAMVALGCTVGTLLSGTMAFSLSGWAFGASLVPGVWLGIWTLGWFDQLGKGRAEVGVDEDILDLRGEPCGVPGLRLERFLARHPDAGTVRVLSDHRPLLEPLEAVAARHGRRLRLERSDDGDWQATIEPCSGASQEP